MIEERKDEQTAVAEDPKGEPNEATSADSGTAQEDGLDELLKEFDERRASTQQEQTQAKPEQSGNNEPLDVAALAALERRLVEQETREQRRDLDSLVGRLGEGLEATPLRVKGLLNALAEQNPVINEVWNNRMVRPKDWEKTESELRKVIAKEFGRKVDKQATDSREAVASAVRSASTAAPPKDLTDRDIASLPKAEWDDLQRKMGVTPV